MLFFECAKLGWEYVPLSRGLRRRPATQLAFLREAADLWPGASFNLRVSAWLVGWPPVT